MRRLACLVALLLTLPAAVGPGLAQDARPVVMVVDFAVAVGWASASEVVTERVIARLREDGSVRVLSRSQTASALQAARLDTRGLLDAADVSRAAQRAGADYVLMGEVEQFDQSYRGGCLPIVGCVYTVTASVHIRGVVVDADTGMVVARPDGSAQQSQGSASVWAGPWWADVTVSNFDAQLIGRATQEAVRQFVARAKPALRPKPGKVREPEVQPSPAEQPEARPAPTPQAPGGLERARVEFRRGNRVLLREDFAGCSLRPSAWQVMQGNVECVRADGRTWLAGVKGESWVEVEVPGLDLSRDFAIEVNFRIERRGEPYFWLVLGRRGSPFSFEVKWENNWRGFWSGKGLPDVVGDLRGAVRQLGLLRQGDTIHVFIDGRRALSDAVDSLALSRLPRRLVFGWRDVDIERGVYAIVTDVVVSTFE